MNILYRKQKEQVSYDNGQTWIDTGNYRIGEELENPSNCQAIQYRWIELPSDEGYYCNFDEMTKYTVQVEESSTDGIIWVRTGNQRQGETVIEQESVDCGFIPEIFTQYDVETIDTDFAYTYNYDYMSDLQISYNTVTSLYGDSPLYSDSLYSHDLNFHTFGGDKFVLKYSKTANYCNGVVLYDYYTYYLIDTMSNNIINSCSAKTYSNNDLLLNTYLSNYKIVGDDMIYQFYGESKTYKYNFNTKVNEIYSETPFSALTENQISINGINYYIHTTIAYECYLLVDIDDGSKYIYDNINKKVVNQLGHVTPEKTNYGFATANDNYITYSDEITEGSTSSYFIVYNRNTNEINSTEVSTYTSTPSKPSISNYHIVLISDNKYNVFSFNTNDFDNIDLPSYFESHIYYDDGNYILLYKESRNTVYRYGKIGYIDMINKTANYYDLSEYSNTKGNFIYEILRRSNNTFVISSEYPEYIFANEYDNDKLIIFYGASETDRIEDECGIKYCKVGKGYLIPYQMVIDIIKYYINLY